MPITAPAMTAVIPETMLITPYTKEILWTKWRSGWNYDSDNKSMAIRILLFKSVGLIQNDFATENDELWTPNADGTNDEHQGDWRGRRKHETPAKNDSLHHIFPISLSLNNFVLV